MKKGSLWICIGLALSLGVVLYCGAQLLMLQSGYERSRQQFDDLAKRFMAETRRLESGWEEGGSSASADGDIALWPEGVTPDRIQPQQDSVLQAFSRLREEYPDMAGWLQIAGTSVNYPVMYTPDRPNYYLRRGLDGKYSGAGVPYLQEDCDITGSDNLVIYGHRMKNGDVFAVLTNYKKKEFFERHPRITLLTPEGEAQYEIFAVCVVSADWNVENVVPYNEFIRAENAEEYDRFVQSAREHSVYDTGVIPAFGEQLLTLSTCDYAIDNGRLAVLARRANPPAEP